MSDSPTSATPYEVLGIAPTASNDELRRAYRRRLRETHPDTGGTSARFHAVQAAWLVVGDPESRSAYDRGSSSASGRVGSARPAGSSSWAARSAPPSTASSLKARSYGHPGGQARERFLTLIREWAGRGAALADPYDPALVRSAPREIRWLLGKALAEEQTARTLSDLGMGFTVWNDVASPTGHKIDHIVLGPAGLLAVRSEDWGDPVRLHRGELAGDAIPDGEQPVRDLVRSARKLGRSLGVRFDGQVIVLPDEALVDASSESVDRGRNAGTLVIARSRLSSVMRSGVSEGDARRRGDVFEVRTRLQQAVQFV
ncbi:DnaJ domain-containing protein [Agreia sp. PsM10]|jgi:molecular chaperone DnaJ|uniref:J domain-containing protein n=1 Tax=Agreia sp. PsM10 TaxID=3030533 RepID=UPI00263A6C0D|nr:DnaJ domain-containing protein [Agreia sp. PsM10]MDN4639481.1 DnaJ domain-containing protein [Agreia sp. PsM10]